MLMLCANWKYFFIFVHSRNSDTIYLAKTLQSSQPIICKFDLLERQLAEKAMFDVDVFCFFTMINFCLKKVQQ